MSEEPDTKPSLDDLDPPSQMDPVTPQKPKTGKILLTITSPEGQTIQVNQKPTATFEKLFKIAVDKFSLDLRLVRFLHEGVRLREHETPDSVGMVDEADIEVQVQQLGGH